jgi:MFS family permease
MQTLAIADAAGGRHGTGIGILYASTHAGWLAGVVVLGQIYRSLPAEQVQYMYLAAAGLTLVGNVLTGFLPATGPMVRERPPVGEVIRIMTRPRAVISGVFQFTSALAFGLILGMFGSYIERTFGRDWIWVSVALYPATLMVMSAVGGHMTDRLGHAPTLFIGFAVGALGLLVTVAWHHPCSVVVAGFALGLLGSTVPIVASAMVGDAADRKRRPLAYGAVFSWRDLGVVTAALGANILGLKLDFNGVFTVFIWIFAACALVSLCLRRPAKDAA